MDNRIDNLQLAVELLTVHNALLLDVRTYEEYCAGHLRGAEFIPTQLPPLSERELQNLREQLMHRLVMESINRPIVIYCKKGIRAQIAVDIVKSFGFNYVLSVGGVQDGPLYDVFSRELPIWPICHCAKIPFS